MQESDEKGVDKTNNMREVVCIKETAEDSGLCPQQIWQAGCTLPGCTREGLVLLAMDFNAHAGHLKLPVCAGAGPADSIVNTHGRQLIEVSTSTGALLCTS